jgi:hypothetical protein
MYAIYTFNKGRYTFWALFNNLTDAKTERDYLSTMLGVDSRMYKC